MAEDSKTGKPGTTAPVATPASAPAAPSRLGASASPRVVTQSTTNAINATPQARTIKCPKCGTDAREVARFCQRCHMTLRFTCPACKNEQRKGGSCEKCGVDFLKYITAVVDAKKDTRDLAQERLEQRSGLVKNILAIPLTGGLSLLGLIRPKKTTKR